MGLDVVALVFSAFAVAVSFLAYRQSVGARRQDLRLKIQLLGTERTITARYAIAGGRSLIESIDAYHSAVGSFGSGSRLTSTEEVKALVDLLQDQQRRIANLVPTDLSSANEADMEKIYLDLSMPCEKITRLAIRLESIEAELQQKIREHRHQFNL